MESFVANMLSPLYLAGDIMRGTLHALRDVFFPVLRGGYFDNGFPSESVSGLTMRLAARERIIAALNMSGATSLAHAYPDAAIWALAASLGIILGMILLCLRATFNYTFFTSAASSSSVSSTGGDECDDNYFWRNAADARRAAAGKVGKIAENIVVKKND